MILEDDRAFESGRRVQIASPVATQDAQIEFFRRQHGRAVLKLRGVDSIDDAEKLKGAELRIPVGDVLPLEDGSFYTFQLRGCRVFSGSEFLGTVTAVLDSGGTEILQVDREGEEILIPFAKAYMKRVDLAEQRIDVELPEGLRDLNR